MRRMTWGARIFLFFIGILLGGAFALLINLLFSSPANADTNTVSSTITGTTTVDKTPPTASAPSIVINNQDVCTTATSVAIQTQILGFATGQTVTDQNCERLKLARSLYGMGMKVAAVSVLCQDERVYNGMYMAGTPCPYLGKIGKAAQAMWDENPHMVPGYDGPQPKKLSPLNAEKTTVVPPNTEVKTEIKKEDEWENYITESDENGQGLAIFGTVAAALLLLL